MSVSIAELRVEHHHDGFGIGHAAPRLSWRFHATTAKDWRQTGYEVGVTRAGGGAEERFAVSAPESVLVPWPSTPLRSRERATVRVRARAADQWTDWASLAVEAALLDRADWTAQMVSCPPQGRGQAKRPFRVRHTFVLPGGDAPAGAVGRLYCTAHGLYEVELNGHRVGDHVLAPGWQSYTHRLHYQTYDVTRLLRKNNHNKNNHHNNTTTNVITAYIAEGWYAGRLGRPGQRDIFGDRLGFLAQLEVDGAVVCATGAAWTYDLDHGPVLAAELYDGEVYDTRVAGDAFAGRPCAVLPFPAAELVAPDVAPVRRLMEVRPRAVLRTPAGRTVLDFGQNLVGWLRIERDLVGARADAALVLRHAEVLEAGELGTRPLRTARARDVVRLGGSTRGHEPRFTFHGFRYAEVSGTAYDAALEAADFTAVVVGSDLRRTGTFGCSHALLTQLHANTVWSMRGNFVAAPTDCPQRDERLGWTGDLQVFAPTAAFLFDTTAFLARGWLRDVAAEQQATGTGVVPIVVPAIPNIGTSLPRHPAHPMAVWADCAVLTPWDVFQASGDRAVLADQWDSMTRWLDQGVPRGPSGLYDPDVVQYGDWLDPRAPPMLPGHGPTDPHLVANAYLVHVTQRAAAVAGLLGQTPAAARYAADAARLRAAFRHAYVSPGGRLASDTQTAYALALHFGLVGAAADGDDGDDDDNDDARACHAAATARLGWLTRWAMFRITTGFAGTPIILPTLADHGMLNLAYRMLQERDCPSWLYPIRMGATTIWERWDSMLEDGRINPGQMTSFNHYALGSVCAFLHGTVGGLSPALPGWKRALVRPRPGGTVRHAATSFDSPYGPYTVRWRLVADGGGRMVTDVTVPPNGEAHVVLGDARDPVDEIVGSGAHHYETAWTDDPAWPPTLIKGPQGVQPESRYVA